MIKINRTICLLIFILNIIVCCVHAGGQAIVKTALVIDNRLPSLNNTQLKNTLKKIQDIMKEQYGADVEVVVNKQFEIDKFFKKYFHYPNDKDISVNEFNYIQDDPERFRFGLLRFCRNYDIKTLMDYCGINSNSAIKDNEQFVEYLISEFKGKKEFLAEIKDINGKNFLDEDNIGYYSLVRWMIVANQCSGYDLILTNAFLLDTFVNDPVVHTFIRGGIAGGFSCPSKGSLKGISIVSFQQFISNERFFKLQRDGNFTENEIPEIVSYMTAHELGHLMFKYADSYDHKHCIMNPPRGLKYTMWMRGIKGNPCKQKHRLLEHL